jgi:hypothetical protein
MFSWLNNPILVKVIWQFMHLPRCIFYKPLSSCNALLIFSACFSSSAFVTAGADAIGILFCSSSMPSRALLSCEAINCLSGVCVLVIVNNPF